MVAREESSYDNREGNKKDELMVTSEECDYDNSEGGDKCMYEVMADSNGNRFRTHEEQMVTSDGEIITGKVCSGDCNCVLPEVGNADNSVCSEVCTPPDRELPHTCDDSLLTEAKTTDDTYYGEVYTPPGWVLPYTYTCDDPVL